MAAAKKIPWEELVKLIPALVVSAKELWNKWGSNQKQPPVDTEAEIKTQIAAIIERLEVLETSKVDQANLMKQIAEQLQGISTGLAEVSRRSSIALLAGICSIVISLTALVTVILR